MEFFEERGGAVQSGWSPLVETNIPNDKSNLNAGLLPDGRLYLVHNPVTPGQTIGNGTRGAAIVTPAGTKQPSFRDPITLSTSADGLAWGAPGVALTCTDLSPSSTCTLRYPGHAKNGGPSYPQALTVIAPAPEAQPGVYVASSNNKEDIWVVKVEVP